MPVSQVVSTYEGHSDILVSSNYTPFTYTLAQNSVTTYTTLADGRSRQVVPEGTVVALDPANSKVILHTSQAGVVGPLLAQADVTDGDQEVTVLWRGDVRLDRIYDNGVLGTLTATAESAFGDRIKVHPSNRP
jgi:hypothetical protein